MPSRRDLEAALADARRQLRRQEHELRDLREEADVLREAAEALIHHAPARERFTFIHALRGRLAVRRICRIIATDHAGYFAWVRAEHKRTVRSLEDRELLQLITEIHTAHPAYGAERITRELKNQGTQVGRRRVARLMRENGIAGITRRQRRNLTKPDKGAAAIPDLLQRNFTAPMPGLKLTGDISCFRTSEGWVYLATVIDLCSKELIGWAIATHMRASLVADAMTMAHDRGLTAGNAIMHTDRGGQYFAKTYQRLLHRLEIRQSTSRTGSCLDGAAAESFFATIKSEIGTDFWPDRASARRDIEHYISDYNTRRLHSAIDYQPPATMRLAWQTRMSIAAQD
ncbi:IS3 family transposase [Actinospica robiniae]|uniref:IS3 family transposase n=1 Tax=Actinospica robiniae TaxID=304901 RepID=UPI0004127864|nr:IS3 family transposase [Actinospica robiniae]